MKKHKKSNIFNSSQDSSLKLISKYSKVQNLQNQEVFKLIRMSSKKKDSNLDENFRNTKKPKSSKVQAD